MAAKRKPLNLNLKEGALRKTAGTKKGEKIPVQDLQRLANSKNPLTAKRATLAINMRSWNKGGKKGK